METNISESISARLVSDKPIKKTPYQVKGVFMKQFSNEKIVPFLDGKLRSKYLYPRVQVKILDEQVYIVGINEGVGPVLSLVDNLEFFNFCDITVKIEKIDVEQNQNPVSLVDKLLRYKFVTPWVAPHPVHRLAFCSKATLLIPCLLYTSPSPRDATLSRMPSSA